MINSNKITNTKIGDDIHFYINGTEDRGIVVKMNNEYVTVFKESTQEFDDIHINDTFFIKDILINKEWDKMDDDERYDALNKIHAPSPRFIMKSWNDLPKEIKELLTKNNAIETSHKEGKDDDMNVVDTREGWDTNKTLNQTSSGKPVQEGTTVGKKIPKGQVGSKPKGGEKEALDAGKKKEPKGYQKNPEAIEDHQRPKEFRSDITAPNKQQGDKNTTGIDFMTEGGGGIGVFEESPLSADKPDKLETRQVKERGRESQGKKGKEITAGISALKAWQLWLAKREQEVLKQETSQLNTDAENEPDQGKRSVHTLERLADESGAVPKSRVGGTIRVEGGGKNRSRQARESKEVSELGYSKGKKQYDKEEKKLPVRGTARETGKKLTISPENAEKWKSWLEEQKSNPERSIHGNAGREPNSGVNTNIGFDASEDYEGFTHSGLRPEQFKHERKKPKVTTKERVNIGETYPSRAGQGTGDGGNPYDTRTQNKTEKGRAKQGKDRN